METFATATTWQQPMTREVILPRLMQRYAAEGTREGLQSCARLLKSAPTEADKARMAVALDQGLPAEIKISFGEVPTDLKHQLRVTMQKDAELEIPGQMFCLRVLARLGDAEARKQALGVAVSKERSATERVQMIQLLGEVGESSSTEPILELVTTGQPEPVQLAALAALQGMSNTAFQKLLEAYPVMKGRVRSKAREVLLGRKEWALAFLKEIDSGTLMTGEIPLEELPKIALLKDPRVDELVRKHWGNVTGGTPEEKLAVVRRFNNDLRAADGDKRRGHEVFTKTCAICHRLFGEGALVGPDLTGANRKDRDYLLVNIVDPSAVIRKEFLNYNVETTDGQFLTGLIAEQSADRIALLAANDERTTIAREKIRSLQESLVSLMPENLLNGLKPQELRDLFVYLQAEKP